jgi:hypothetical protein
MRLSGNPAQRRYTIRVGIASVAYVITLTVALKAIESGAVTGLPAYALGLLPGLSVAAVFWAIGRLLVEETDEYLRLLLVRQTLIATGLTLTLVTIWGFLETLLLVPHVEAFYVAVLWFAGLGVGSCVNRLTMGDRGDTE